MYQTSMIRSFETTKFKALELPFKGNKYAMYVVIPKRCYLHELFKNITLLQLLDNVTSVSPELTKVRLPVFDHVSWSIPKKMLQKRGMKDAYDLPEPFVQTFWQRFPEDNGIKRKANFSGFSNRYMAISGIFHQASIKVRFCKYAWIKWW